MTADQTYAEWREAPLPDVPGVDVEQCWDVNPWVLDEAEEFLTRVDAERVLRSVA